LFNKVIVYVKDEGSNLNTLINALKSIFLCSLLQLFTPFVGSCFGHAMSKAAQCATSDAKICQGFSNSSQFEVYSNINAKNYYLD
jgi:hypothetical protein